MMETVLFLGIPGAATATARYASRVIMLKVALKDVPPEKRPAIIKALFDRREK
ncbi:hypothetical protein ACIRRA_44265 [Nocardia sp. NPDC101769]|uniref:hypothetical protein n=1 Tax=Nocardia sp. NPDC101769 TaxID=3364333 RepID=UPI00380DD40E